MKSGFEELVKLKDMLFEIRMTNAKHEDTEDWTGVECLIVLKLEPLLTS